MMYNTILQVPVPTRSIYDNIVIVRGRRWEIEIELVRYRSKINKTISTVDRFDVGTNNS